MSLAFAALAPHPPLLIPSIGKELVKKIDKTKQALEKLEEDLYLAKPDIICIVSPHGHWNENAFSINLATEFKTDLREFGDLATQLTFKGAPDLAAAIQRASRGKEYVITSFSESGLDHGASVPLYYLTQHLPNVSILPLSFSNLDWKSHLDFGALLKEQIMKTNKRVAVIASGDLSHALTTEAPAGFNQAGPDFDKKIQELLSAKNTSQLLSLDPKFVNEAAECGFRSLLILLGVLRDLDYTYQSYAYEGPFGVGYLTANFVL